MLQTLKIHCTIIDSSQVVYLTFTGLLKQMLVTSMKFNNLSGYLLIFVAWSHRVRLESYRSTSEHNLYGADLCDDLCRHIASSLKYSSVLLL